MERIEAYRRPRPRATGDSMELLPLRRLCLSTVPR